MTFIIRSSYVYSREKSLFDIERQRWLLWPIKTCKFYFISKEIRIHVNKFKSLQWCSIEQFYNKHKSPLFMYTDQTIHTQYQVQNKRTVLFHEIRSWQEFKTPFLNNGTPLQYFTWWTILKQQSISNQSNSSPD